MRTCIVLTLADDTIEQFMERHNLKNEGRCGNCGKDVVFNKFWYEPGLAVAVFEHECPQFLSPMALIPIGKEKEKLRRMLDEFF